MKSRIGQSFALVVFCVFVSPGCLYDDSTRNPIDSSTNPRFELGDGSFTYTPARRTSDVLCSGRNYRPYTEIYRPPDLEGAAVVHSADGLPCWSEEEEATIRSALAVLRKAAGENDPAVVELDRLYIDPLNGPIKFLEKNGQVVTTWATFSPIHGLVFINRFLIPNKVLLIFSLYEEGFHAS